MAQCTGLESADWQAAKSTLPSPSGHPSEYSVTQPDWLSNVIELLASPIAHRPLPPHAQAAAQIVLAALTQALSSPPHPAALTARMASTSSLGSEPKADVVIFMSRP